MSTPHEKTMRRHNFVHNIIVPQIILLGCISVYLVFALIIATSVVQATN